MAYNADKYKPTTPVVDDNPQDDFEIPSEEFSFEDSIDSGEKKEVFTVYGEKNGGKTTISYGIPHIGNKILVFSFDKKSTRPKDASYIKNANLNIQVIDANKYLDKSSEENYLESAVTTHKFIISMLNQAKDKFGPDWIMFDATERMNSLMELAMRKHNNLKPYQGIANRTLWKERTQYLDDIHMRAMDTSKYGVIYTMYSTKNEIIKEGNVINKTDVPKWVGTIMEETDVVIHAETEFKNGQNVFYARIEGSKLPEKYPDKLYDITGKRLRDVLPSED